MDFKNYLVPGLLISVHLYMVNLYNYQIVKSHYSKNEFAIFLVRHSKIMSKITNYKDKL